MMLKNQPFQSVDAVMIVRVDGTDGTGLTPTVRIRKDQGNWAAGGGTVTEGEDGAYRYELTQTETNCDHLVVKFTEATALTALINLYPIDPTIFQADVSGLSTFDHTTDQVITDTASRDASKADVSGLSTFDHTTDQVITDTASRDASKADVSNLDVAVSTRLADADAIKKGASHRYTNTGGGAGFDDVTVTDAP
jgi:hypothetical protein